MNTQQDVKFIVKINDDYLRSFGHMHDAKLVKRADIENFSAGAKLEIRKNRILLQSLTYTLIYYNDGSVANRVQKGIQREIGFLVPIEKPNITHSTQSGFASRLKTKIKRGIRTSVGSILQLCSTN